MVYRLERGEAALHNPSITVVANYSDLGGATSLENGGITIIVFARKIDNGRGR